MSINVGEEYPRSSEDGFPISIDFISLCSVSSGEEILGRTGARGGGVFEVSRVIRLALFIICINLSVRRGGKHSRWRHDVPGGRPSNIGFRVTVPLFLSFFRANRRRGGMQMSIDRCNIYTNRVIWGSGRNEGGIRRRRELDEWIFPWNHLGGAARKPGEG